MKTKFLFAIGILFFMTSSSLFAQRGYIDLKTEDSLKIQYRWHRVSLSNKDSDAVLNLRVTNLSPSAVKWTFTVVFYNDKMAVHESEVTEVCLKPGQSLRGGLAGLRYSLEGMKLDAVEKEGFSWEFETFEVEEVPNCLKSKEDETSMIDFKTHTNMIIW
jgi:hypothetical protein